jgi:hypothetical protein
MKKSVFVADKDINLNLSSNLDIITIWPCGQNKNKMKKILPLVFFFGIISINLIVIRVDTRCP